jgi:hypothetical protein
MTFPTLHIGHSRHGLFFTRWIVNQILPKQLRIVMENFSTVSYEAPTKKYAQTIPSVDGVSSFFKILSSVKLISLQIFPTFISNIFAYIKYFRFISNIFA